MRVIISVILTLCFLSCEKKEIGPQLVNKDGGSLSDSSRVLVLNEGNFNLNNSSISAVDINSQTISNNIFNSLNNSSLGDVCQSGFYFKSKCYLVINNSQKIVVLDSSSLLKINEINGFSSPRYIYPVSNNKAYVTNLYVNNSATDLMYVVNLNTGLIDKTIITGGYTEELIQYGNKVYVTKRNSNDVLVINSINDSIENTISVGYDPLGIVMDINDEIWVLTSGGYLNQHTPQLNRINPSNDSVEFTLNFSSNSMNPDRLRIDRSKENLFYINDGVFKMNIADQSIPSTPVINSLGRNFYGLGIHPVTNHIFVTNANDFQQIGSILQFDENFQFVKSYQTGIIPQHLLF